MQWPIAFFDIERQEAKPRHPKDADITTVNMVINEAKGRANRIKMRYFSDSKMLTRDLFANEFENYESRENYLHYWKTKQLSSYNDGLISEGTNRNHNTSYARLVEFNGGSEYLPHNPKTKWLNMVLFR